MKLNRISFATFFRLSRNAPFEVALRDIPLCMMDAKETSGQASLDLKCSTLQYLPAMLPPFSLDDAKGWGKCVTKSGLILVLLLSSQENDASMV